MIRAPRGRQRSKKNTSGRKQRKAIGRKLFTEVLEDRQLLASDVASSVCAAGTCTEQEPFSGVPDLNDVAIFDQFDSSLGTLLSVKVSLEVSSDGGSFQADNDSDQPATLDVSFGAEGTISSTDVGLFSAVVPIPTGVIGAVSTSQGATFNLTGNDGDDTTVFNPGGSDWDTFEGTVATSMDMGVIDPSLFAAYEGTGTFGIDYEIDQVADTSSAGGVFLQIDPVTASGSITVEYTFEPLFNPDIDLEKFLYEVNDSTDLSGDIFPGDSLLYVFEVQNTGDIVLDNVSVSDSLPGVTIGAEVFTSLANVDADAGVTFDGDLDPSETVFFVGSYTVTEADATAGEIVNNATVTGDDPSGTPTDDGGTDVTIVQPTPINPAIELDKFVWDVNGVPSTGEELNVGDEILYAFEVTNTGDVELTSVGVTDALPGVVIGSDVFATTSPFTQPTFIPDDGNLGAFASIDSTLASDPFEAKAWDNFTLTGDTLLDGIDWTGAYIEPFAVGLIPETDFVIEIFSDASDMPGALLYSFSLDGGEAGVSDGEVTSTLLGHTAEDGGPVFEYSADLPKTDIPAGDYWISITAEQTFPNPFPKIDPTWQWHLGSGSGDGFFTYDDIFDDAGDNGNGLVDGTPTPTVRESGKDLAFTFSGMHAAPFDGSLDPGESAVFVGTYTVTEDDAIAGEVVNNATASGEDPNGDPVNDDDTETVPVVQVNSSIDVDKFLWDINGSPDLHPNINAGDELLYAFNVTNTGETKLSNVTVTDSLPGFVLDDDVSIPFTAFEQPAFIPADGNLGPFASKDSLSVTDDQEAKAWDNFSIAKPTVIEGISWTGAYIEPFVSGGLTPETDFFIEIFVDNGSGAPGHLVEYFPLRGGMAGVSDENVTSTLLGHTAEDGGPVYSYDAMLPFTLLQSGEYWLSITALQSFPNPAPAIDPTWQWHVGSGDGDGFFTYDDIFDDTGDGRPFPAQFSDGKDLAFTLNAAELDPDFNGMLLPGETVMFMGTYIVTEADVAAGEVINKGTVTADDPRGDEVMDMDTETTPIASRDPDIEIDKFLWDINGSPTLTTEINVGDELIYSLDVTNTGGVKLSNVEVTDSLPGGVFDDQVVVPFIAHEQLFDIPADGNLGPFASVDRTLSSDPQEAKAWDNFSFAEDTVIDGVSWVGAYIEPFATGAGVETPETDFLIEIFSDDSGPDAAVLSFTVNGGEAGVDDGQLMSTELFHTALDGGSVFSYKAMVPFTYIVAGDYWISITALQTFPNEAPTVDPTWQWHLADENGADGFFFYDDVFDDVGDGTPTPTNFQEDKDLTFTLHGAEQVDFNGMLNPGEQVMFMFTYIVTEEDVLAGEIVNKGTVTADDPSGGTVMDMDTETVIIDTPPVSPPMPPADDPSIFIDKYLWDINGSPDLHNDIKVGDELIYGIDIENTGNVKLSDIVVTDQVYLVEVDEEVAVPYIAVDQAAFVPDSGEIGAFSSVDRTLASDPQEAKAWDNFTVNRADDWTVIDAVSWYGAYSEPFADGLVPQTDFLIELAEADGSGKPGTVVHSYVAKGGDAGVDDENVRTTLLDHTTPDGGPVYSYHAMTPFMGLVNGDYFISVTALQTFPNDAPTIDPTWQWHLGSGSGDGFYTYDDAFDDVGDGTPFAANLEEGKDLAFTLHAAELVDNFDGMLEPGERVMFMARYTVRQVDIDKGTFQNDAKVVATAPDGTVLTELDWEHVDINQNPSVTLAAAPAVGQTGQVGASTSGMVPMLYTVTNEGDVTLDDVVVIDNIEGPAAFVGTDVGEDGLLSPGEVWLFDGMGQNGSETVVRAETPTGEFITEELSHEFCEPTNGDIDGDGVVGFSDFLVLSRNFGANGADLSMGDIDCDGQVAFGDFLVLSRNFGQSTVAGQDATAAAAAVAADAAFDADDEEDWLI